MSLSSREMLAEAWSPRVEELCIGLSCSLIWLWPPREFDVLYDQSVRTTLNSNLALYGKLR